jgi:hypothetical protein
LDRGYIKLWRKTLDTEILKNKNLWSFWGYCLLRATHRSFVATVGLQEVHLEPGQFIFGRKRAAFDLSMTEREIRTCVQCLSNMKNVTIKTTNKFSIISIVNWNIYQQTENGNDQQNVTRTTSRRPADDHIQEHKNINTNTRTRKTIVATDTGLRLSTYLFSFIKDRNNGHKPPDLNKWGVDMDKMIRIDARDPTDIEKVICWCQQDDFWKNNILSPDKLRKQFDQLKLKMNPRNDKVERVAEWLLK